MIRGNIFKNWNKTCYISSKQDDPDIDEYGNEINVYNKPIKYSFNIQPAGGDFDIALYGERVSKVYRAIVPFSYKDKIKEGDIAYLDGVTPDSQAPYGDNANYVVDSVRPQNLATAIYFTKIDK